MRVALLLIAAAMSGCAGATYRHPESKRQERAEYVMAYGSTLTWEVKNAYIEGRLIPGMPYLMAEMLYGEPDTRIKCPRQNLICDVIFVYALDKHNTAGSVSIKDGLIISVTGQLAEAQRF